MISRIFSFDYDYARDCEEQSLSDQINYLKIIEIDAKRGVVLVLREIIIEAGIQTGELPYQWKQKLNWV